MKARIEQHPPAEPSNAEPRSVCVVVTTYNHAHFLGQALDSLLAQTRPADEIIVVDDGSADDPAAVAARYPGVRLIRQANQGLAAARNTGLAASSSDAVVFLDADDLLLPRALEAGLDCLARHPGAAFAAGGHRRVDEAGEPIGPDQPAPPGLGYFDLLLGNRIGMHATVIYRRSVLAAAGGFAPELRRCEDYDVYLRLARDHPVATHREVVADYRQHGANMSRLARDMRDWVLKVHARQREYALADPEFARAWTRGQAIWREYYDSQAHRARAAGFEAWTRRWLPERLRRPARGLWRRLGLRPGGWKPRPFGRVDLGDLDRLSPISDDFGYDRGTPIDRGYIEDFLARHAGDIRGRVLEVGDDAYSRRFGRGRIAVQDVLHVRADAPGATIAGDMSQPGVMPEAAFDCLVLTQTLHIIFDMAAAVREMHRALKPGGVVLLTVPGISRIDRGEWGPDWCWSLTENSARRLFETVFGAENVTTETHGNVFAAVAFLHGLAVEEVDQVKLGGTDPCFPVIVTVRAQKAA